MRIARLRERDLTTDDTDPDLSESRDGWGKGKEKIEAVPAGRDLHCVTKEHRGQSLEVVVGQCIPT